MTQPAEVTTAPEVEQIPNLFLPEDDDGGSAPAAPAPVEAPEAPVEALAAPVATPEQERVAARLERAKKTELRAARERAEIQSSRAALEAERAQWAKIKDNPIAALNELKLDPDEFLKRVISDGKPSPESEIAEIRATLKAQAEENLRLRSEREQYFQTQSIEKAKDDFVTMVEGKYSAYEHILSEYTPEEIREYGFQIARQEGPAYKEENGEDIPDEYIAERLNEFAKARSDKRNAWSQRVKGTGLASQATVESAKVASPQVNRATAPRTLTNGSASLKQSSPATQRTQEEIDAECVRILQAAIKPD